MNFRLRGTATDPQGRRPADCTVVAYTTNSAHWDRTSRFLDRAACRHNESFEILRLPPGDYFVAAVGRTSAEVSEEWPSPEWLKALTPRATRVMPTEGGRLELFLALFVP